MLFGLDNVTTKPISIGKIGELAGRIPVRFDSFVEIRVTPQKISVWQTEYWHAQHFGRSQKKL
jgi:hypothetical protein